MMRTFNGVLSKHFQSIFIAFLVMQPIFDIFTSLMVKYLGAFVTVGFIIRMCILILVFYYCVFVVVSQYKRLLVSYLIILFAYTVFFTVNIIILKGNTHLFEEAKALIKFYYFPIMLVFIFFLYNSDRLKVTPKQIATPGILYSILILIAVITGTSFMSYGYGKLGSAGWYYAPNEIGAVLAILFPVYYFSLIKNYKKWTLFILLPVFCGMCLWIGTKVPMISVLVTPAITTVVYLFKVIFQHNRIKNLVIIAGSALLCALILLVIPLTPSGKNLGMDLQLSNIDILEDYFGVHAPDPDTVVQEPEPNTIVGGEDVELEKTVEKDTDKVIFNNRDVFFARELENYKDASLMEKLIGRGFMADDGSNYVTVEMDFFDLFFGLGIVGITVYLLPALVLLWIVVIQLLKIPKNILDDEKVGYVIALGLAFGIAAIAGHVISAPAVSIYIAVILPVVNATVKNNGGVVSANLL